MKVERNIMLEVAFGKTSITGEATKIAWQIIFEGLKAKFKKFAFFYDGDENNILDLQDCILDFRSFGAEIVFENIPKKVNPFGTLRISGMTIRESLERLFDYLTDNELEKMDIYEDKIFKVKGIKGKFKLSYTLLHYCFAKSRISSEDCLKLMRI
jgi:hypothetical protein